MKYLSVCSGIEAATCAWHPLGWEPVGFSEIDPFPRSVLKHHYPNVPLFGDFTEIQADDIEPIDLLVGGTPCQSFSVAGLRGGMADDRGNLALEFCRLALRTRPRWIVWENVPGVLSSNEGRDFGSFLGALAQCGYGFAYRVLDAQFVRVQSHAFAVPQRRRRVFVVGYLGDWRRAAQVLFERESMCGHPPPRRESGQSVAGTIISRATAGGGLGTDFELAGGVVASTLRSDHSVSGNPEAVVVSPLRTSPYGDDVSSEPHLVIDDVSHCLNAGGMGRQDWETESFVATSVALASDPIHSRECAQPVTCRNGDAGTIQKGNAVRRLTPRECERLQGFPDGWTDVPYRGKPACDGPRYKAIGNSMAVNVMSWIGRRIMEANDGNRISTN